MKIKARRIYNGFLVTMPHTTGETIDFYYPDLECLIRETMLSDAMEADKDLLNRNSYGEEVNIDFSIELNKFAASKPQAHKSKAERKAERQAERVSCDEVEPE